MGGTVESPLNKLIRRRFDCSGNAVNKRCINCSQRHPLSRGSHSADDVQLVGGVDTGRGDRGNEGVECTPGGTNERRLTGIERGLSSIVSPGDSLHLLSMDQEEERHTQLSLFLCVSVAVSG